MTFMIEKMTKLIFTKENQQQAVKKVTEDPNLFGEKIMAQVALQRNPLVHQLAYTTSISCRIRIHRATTLTPIIFI